jgi:LPXTG-motif cell wall-anchored protein
MKKLAIVVFLAGLAITIFTTITFFTKDKIVDLGEIEITRQNPQRSAWLPVTGIAIMAIGGILFWKKDNKQ